MFMPFVKAAVYLDMTCTLVLESNISLRKFCKIFVHWTELQTIELIGSINERLKNAAYPRLKNLW